MIRNHIVITIGMYFHCFEEKEDPNAYFLAFIVDNVLGHLPIQSTIQIASK